MSAGEATQAIRRYPPLPTGPDARMTAPTPNGGSPGERLTQVFEMAINHLDHSLRVLGSIQGDGSIAGAQPTPEPSATMNTLMAQAMQLRDMAINVRERLERIANTI